MRIPNVLLLALLCCGCTAFPDLPEVRGLSVQAGTPKVEGETVERRFPVSDLTEPPQEGSPGTNEALEALPDLVEAALSGEGVTQAVFDQDQKELVVTATAKGGKKVEALLASLRSAKDQPLRVEASVFDADPRGLRSWDVFFRPLVPRPGFSGEGACALLPCADLDRWLEAATKARAARVGRFPVTAALPLQEARSGFSCQVSYVSHFEVKEAGGAQVLDPVMASLAHGFSASLWAVPLAESGEASVRFRIVLRKPAKGVRCALLQMKRMSIHVPNILDKRVAGTVCIPEGSCAVIALGSVGCWGSDPEPPGKGWITFVVLKPVPAADKALECETE